MEDEVWDGGDEAEEDVAEVAVHQAVVDAFNLNLRLANDLRRKYPFLGPVVEHEKKLS